MKQLIEINGVNYDPDTLVELHIQAGYVHVTYYDSFKGKNLTDVYADSPTYKIKVSDKFDS